MRNYCLNLVNDWLITGMKIQISNDTKKLIEHLNYDMEIHGEFSFKVDLLTKNIIL